MLSYSLLLPFHHFLTPHCQQKWTLQLSRINEYLDHKGIFDIRKMCSKFPTFLLAGSTNNLGDLPALTQFKHDEPALMLRYIAHAYFAIHQFATKTLNTLSPLSSILCLRMSHRHKFPNHQVLLIEPFFPPTQRIHLLHIQILKFIQWCL